MTPKELQDDAEEVVRQAVGSVSRLPPDAEMVYKLRRIVKEAYELGQGNHLEGWVADGRDADGNLILRYRDTGGLYRVVPIEES